MHTPPINLAIIGCGLAARDLHWPALRHLTDQFRIAIVCNHTPEKARSFADLVGGGVPWTQDYHEAIAERGVDAVSIILPVELNLPVTEAALRAGKHVIVEKPLALDAAESARMVALAREFPTRVTMVAENYRYRPTLRRLGEMLRAGAIGRVYACQWTTMTDMAPETSAYGRTQWRLDHKYAGGYLTDGGVHTINGIRLLFGEIVELRSRTLCVNRTIGEVDTHFMEFETERGVTGTLTQAYSARGYAESRLLVLGTEGTIRLEGNRIAIHRRGIAVEEIATPDDGGYRGQYEAFHAAIAHGTPTETSFPEAARDLAVMLAAMKSAESGEKVEV